MRIKVIEPESIVNGLGLGIEFSVDEDTQTQVIKVIDRKTGEVVRKVPSEDVLNFLSQFQKNQGIFLSLRI